MKVKKIINKKSILGLIILIIIVLSYHFFRSNKKENIYIEDYEYINVEKTNVVGSISLNGQIMANNPIGIFVDKKLKVKEVPVKNGDYVEKNQLLITFDDEEKNKIERNIEKERINLEKIQRNLKALKELYNIGGVSLEEVKILEGDYKISKLNLEELQEVLGKTSKEIRSPVDGVISNLKAQKNYLVDTDTSLMEIIDSDDLKIIIEIPEYDSTMVKIGDDTKIKLESTEDEKLYKGEISKISKLSRISELTSENILEAEIKLKEKIDNFIPGFKIKANIDLKSNEKNIVIPKISLVFENDKYYIFVVDKNNKYKILKREIKIKNIKGENIIVISGIEENEKIVKIPDKRLKDETILVDKPKEIEEGNIDDKGNAKNSNKSGESK